MSTDFNNNTISTSGGIKPSTKNTPTRIGERIETLEDITSIPNPYIGSIGNNSTFEIQAGKASNPYWIMGKNGVVRYK